MASSSSAQSSSPTIFEWLAAVAVLAVQLNGFITLPDIMSGQPIDSDSRNPLNTSAIAFSTIVVGIACLYRIKETAWSALNNPFAVLLAGVILVSVAWSIHPDVTFRRSAGYALTTMIALYLSGRFAIRDVIRMVSWVSAVALFGSFLFVAAFPEYGIMHDIGGGWRGVFPHKNRLGLFAAVGVFIELYLLSERKPWCAWHCSLLVGHLTLVVLSRSATALLLALGYLTGFGVYWISRSGKRTAMGGLGVLVVGLCALFALIVLAAEPQFALGLVGKETTFTGRTGVWAIALRLIELRPVLGWGYGALWLGERNFGLIGWAPASSHNAFLEVALNVGVLGAVILLIVLIIALWRALRCWLAGNEQLGALSLVFFIPTILAGTTEITLAQNQNAEWLLFSVLSFSCGLELARQAKRSSRFHRVAR